MAGTSSLPDDLTLEYDLLQFVENDDAGAHALMASAATAHAQFQFLNVDDLLGNSGIVLESLDAPPSLDQPTPTLDSVGTSNANSVDELATTTPDKPEPTIPSLNSSLEDDLSADASSLLDDLFLNSDDLLAHLEAEAAVVDAAPCASSPCPSTCRTDPASPCTSEKLGDCVTPPPGAETKSFDLNFNTSMSPACTPTVDAQLGLPLPQTVLTLASSPSRDDTTEGDEEGTSSSESTEDDADDEIVFVEPETAEPIEMYAMEDDGTIQHNHDLLSKEAKYLEAQYDYLVSRAKTSRQARQSVKAKRRAREEKKEMSQKTGDNALLTQLVAQQQVYMDNFKAMLAFAPVNDIRMALMTPIESYIRLGRDFDERRRTILSLREEKLDMTYKYIEEKARGIDVNQPYQYSDVFERFGKYYSVHFAVSKYEGVEVGQVVKVVYDQMAGKDESIASAMGCLTIRESYDQIKCNFLHQRIVSSLKWSEEFVEGLPELESNSLFFCRFVGDTAVFATDYIDQDDLHPYQSKDRIRKDVSSGVVLTAHVDENGNRCVIMKKFLMAKFHMYPHNLSEKLTHILFNKMPAVSQKVTRMIDQKLLNARGQSLPHAHPCQKQPPAHPCTEALNQQTQHVQQALHQQC